MTDTMRAVVLDAPGPPDALTVRDPPIARPAPSWVLIRVKAFGLNRSELHTRLGLAEGVTFPRVLGIEAAGIVAECPGEEFAQGQQVMAMMGGMGRTFDGGYAEYTCVPAGQIVPFRSDLDWSILGAVPEMLQTSHGILTIGLDARPGRSILVRGGTSSVGMTTAILAKQRGMTVLSTTRNPDKARRCGASASTTSSSTTDTSPPRYAGYCPTAPTRRWNWSAPPPCPTRSGRSVHTVSSVSPACCPTSGRAGLLPHRLVRLRLGPAR